jgi:hypothetical protein
MTENKQPLQLLISPKPPVETAGVGFPVSVELRPGDLCPRCRKEKLDYDGALNLACPCCGLVQGGCFS